MQACTIARVRALPDSFSRVPTQLLQCGSNGEGSSVCHSYVTLETSMGKVVVELYWKHAPKTCQNLASLAVRGYYNNTKFHRIIPGFMVQGCDPTATGKGGDSIYGQVDR